MHRTQNATQVAPEFANHTVIAHAVVDTPEARAFVAALPSVREALQRWQHVVAPHSRHALSAVHELAWARALGLGVVDLADGAIPMAALMSAQPHEPQAWVSLCHWDVAVDTARLIPVELLQISEQEIEQIRRQLADLAQNDGWAMLQAHPTQAATWAIKCDSFRGLTVASWSRVADAGFDGGVDSWLGELVGQSLRQLRRLQNEFQMLMYTDLASEARIAAGLLPINSFWLHGAGAVRELPDGFDRAGRNVALSMRLTDAALRGDWAQWRATWVELDAALIAQLRRGELKSLTLCGPSGYLALGEASIGVKSRFLRLIGRWSPDSLIGML